MTQRFESRIKKGFAGVAVILVLAVTLAVANSHQLQRAREASARSEEILRELEGILATMIDAETGMRGYIITGEDAYMEPYQRAISTIDARTSHLKNLLGGPETDGRFDQLQKAIADQIAFRKSAVEKMKAASGSETMRRTIRIDEGKRGMDEIRATITHMEAEQERRLAERNEKSEAMDHRSIGMLILFVVLTIGLLIGGLALVKHHLAAREKLEEERNRFFTLSHDMYCIADANGYFKEVNASAEKILGYTAEELKSRPFIEFVHPDDRAATAQEAEKLGRGGRTIYFENRYRTKSGDYKWMLWSASPVPKEKLVYAVARDITEHKKTEERMAELAEESRQRAAELETLNKELEAFSYSVSHDLRAPLRHIAGFSDMLQRHADGSLDEKGKRYLNTIVDSAKRMGNLIDDLLVFSRMGRAEMRRERIDLDTLVDETIQEIAPDVGTRRVSWKRHPLPDVMGDRALLKQVIYNLLSNALKYSSKRNVSEIEIGARDEADECVIFVRDNGVGFDMEYAHKLFGVFQRLHDASDFEGTGIGLANVRRIISRHGGRVWAEAELDKGATFYFSLPKIKTNAAV
jgi:PAS domain S-box-containing protein